MILTVPDFILIAIIEYTKVIEQENIPKNSIKTDNDIEWRLFIYNTHVFVFLMTGNQFRHCNWKRLTNLLCKRITLNCTPLTDSVATQ